MATKRPRSSSPDPAAAGQPDAPNVAAVAPWLQPGERLPCIVDDDEPMGGDAPCWAHLFEDDDEAPPSGR